MARLAGVNCQNIRQRASLNLQIAQTQASAHRQYNKYPTAHTAYLDEDSHADMHCAGSSFVLLAYTGYTCDVDPFHESYESRTNVEIVKAATAVNLSAYETVYLVCNAALWFGDSLHTSLFNANIARDAGLSICTDPYDPQRTLSIQDQEKGLTLPMERRGNCIGLETFKPDANEVLHAIAEQSDNVIFLDPFDEYSPEDNNVRTSQVQITSDSYSTLQQISEALNPELFAQRIISIASTASLNIRDRHSKVTPERVSEIFGCGIETAKETIRVTTQHGVRSAIHPLRRRYRTDLLSLRYRRLARPFYTDTMFFKTVSINQYKCAQVYASNDFVIVYPMRSHRGDDIGDSLRLLAEDVGVPNELVYDRAPGQTGYDQQFQKTARFLRIKCRTSEPYTQKQNHVERTIGELRRRWRDVCRKKQVPKRLWDYVLVWVAQIMCRTYNASTGRTGLEAITGDSVDISEWVDFGMYDPVWYWDTPHDEENPRPGRWLGVSHRVGSALCYWVVNMEGHVLSRTTVQHVTEVELKTNQIFDLFQQLDKSLQTKLSDKNFTVKLKPGTIYEADHDDTDPSFKEVDEGIDEPTPIDPNAIIGDMEEDGQDTFDQYLGAEVITEIGPEGGPRRGRVIKRAKGEDGRPLGTAHGNPYLDSRRYIIDYDNGIQQELTANQIAENLYSQVDSEGRRQLIVKEIIDHKKSSDAIDRSDGFIQTSGGQLRPKITTKGWKLKVQWQDGTASWLPLSELKHSNPVDTAEYATLAKIADEPAFNWWVPTILRTRKKIIGKIKSKYWRTTHKFGIRLPHSIEEALRIDHKTNTDFWTKAIEKEMARVRVAFEKWQGGNTVEEAKSKLVGYQQIKAHMIFDVKLDGLVRKARLVADGHMTDTPSSVTYSSVVSRDSVRLAFLIAALNDLDIMSADIGNAYLNAPNKEKNWMVAGPEFGTEQGNIYLVTRALYGLKSAGASWRSHFAQVLVDLGFKSTRGDPDVYIREAVRPNGEKYYEYLLSYVDDILILSHNTKPIIEELTKRFRLKEDSLGPPSRYLGASIKIYTDRYGVDCWAMSSDDYVKIAVGEVERDLETAGHKLRGKAYRPFYQSYRPEVDVTPPLNAAGIAKYQAYMGVFRWMIELGRVDILTEVSMLSSHQAMPREGHLEACYQIFAFLKRNPNMSVVFHPSMPKIKESRFADQADWTDFYGDDKEELPADMPKPLGKAIHITVYVDADHAGNLQTRRSHTGYLIFCNNAPIIWYSKRQNTVESSTFGSESIAMRTCVEAIEALRFKLRMFGVPIMGPADVLCDNKSVVNSTQRPECVISKKHLAICYHRSREAVARGVMRVGKIESEANLSDLFSKILPQPTRQRLLQGIVYTSRQGLRPVEPGDYRLNRGMRSG